MKLSFTKMHGLGNDFVVLDATEQPIELSQAQIAFMADRKFGIGCDQILMVEATSTSGVDFRYRIFNADGTEVEQCGNGARCFAKFVNDNGLSQQNPILVETQSGVISLMRNEDGSVTVDMGEPQFAPERIPLLADVVPDTDSQLAHLREINKDGDAIRFYTCNMGNPHAVVLVNNVDSAPVLSLGPMLESHPMFPQKTNVGFMQIKARDHISLRVFERGVGETLACGTGACAAVASGIKAGLLDSRVRVTLAGGEMQVEWSELSNSIMMTGPAVTVFEGQVEL